METNLTNAFLLLAIGMITVVLVLSLVMICGNLLIKIVNKLAPEPKPKVPLKRPLISNQKIAVMAAVVEHVTGGLGKIDSIEKVK